MGSCKKHAGISRCPKKLRGVSTVDCLTCEDSNDGNIVRLEHSAEQQTFVREVLSNAATQNWVGSPQNRSACKKMAGSELQLGCRSLQRGGNFASQAALLSSCLNENGCRATFTI